MKFGHNLALKSEFETVLYICKESFFVGQFRGSKIFFVLKGPFEAYLPLSSVNPGNLGGSRNFRQLVLTLALTALTFVRVANALGYIFISSTEAGDKSL